MSKVKKDTNEKSKQSKAITIEEQYKKKSLHEHILDLPDTYIGSVENDLLKNIFVFDDAENMIVRRDKYIVLGLYKIFDEILVNAADNTVRDTKCNVIKVNIDKESGEIQVYNNGSTIPIEIHKDENMYVPEMIFGTLLTSGNYDQKGKIVGGKNGLGSKCHSQSTPVPTFDGKIKIAGDLTLNDKLIGDDGKIRNILKIIKGNGQLYKVIQGNGEPYTVNDQHILTLHMPDHKVIFWNSSKNGWSMLWWNHETNSINHKTIKISHNYINCPECNIQLHGNLGRHYKQVHKDKEIPKQPRKSPTINPPDTLEVKLVKEEMENFAKTITDNNIIDMSIQDYMKLSNTTKLRLAGLRGECVDWEHKDVKLDPYVLGLWLGDGFQTGLGYACFGEKDPEIINYLEEWGKDNDANIKKVDKYHYIFSSKSNFGKKGSSPLKKLLKQYDLVNNKHIPLDYIVNDRDTRLKVLAGLIDTDGTVQRDDKSIVITQGPNHEKLANDIVLLARSLGFICCLTIKKTSQEYKGEKKKVLAYNINISGENIVDIPTLLPRKKTSSDRHDSSRTTGYLTVEDAGIGDYVGLEIDGNQRFVINDFTVTHNCASIYSEFFDVEICDPTRKKKYYQRFSNNMFDKSEPKIVPVDKNAESYTKITFLPDYKRFGLKHLTNDMISLMKRRVYDIAGTTNSSVKVYYNEEFLDIQSFQDYIKMFYSDEDVNIIYEDVNERWSVGIVFDNQSGFQHMSFVNRISTFQGGTHLNYVVNQIVDQVTTHIQTKHKNLKIKAHQVKENISVFVNAVIEDPAFGSQTKETLTTKASSFNVKCELSEKFIQKICKTGLINEIIQVAQIKQLGELEKSDGKKNVNLKSLTKLDDARLAGTKRSPECRLIVTEGDSAKTFAISGLELIGRDLYGVFPLKGKLLNVRNAAPNQLLNNEEIKNLKQIMGLKQNATYTDTKKLRYGGIIILTDQDVDGSHIKGLLMNFFHYFWPSLIKIEGFIQSIATPIVKAYKVSDTKKTSPEIFHTLTEYKKWCEKIGDDVNKKYRIKYFKGLGTSTSQEAKESFTDFENKIVNYVWTINNSNIINAKNDIYADISDNESSKNEHSKTESDNISVSDEVVDKNEPSYQAITLAFAKQRENDRKEWVRQYDSGKIIENNIKKIPIYDFVNKDLIHFSFGDNIRSIPDLVDGLKPSQRKILFGVFKRRLDNDEIKVAQLSGYISEHTGYHHGEASLQGAIINMAQDFCGSNNINLLYPSGNFGTRRMGGKDAASSRYIFTQLSTVTRNIYINKDEPVLESVLEEGDIVEPVRYYPIIPMILVNGSEGIGTGFSTNIPPYNPLEIIDNIRKILKGTSISKITEMVPWYSSFIGKIEKENQNTYRSIGNIEVLNEFTVKITELPIGMWAQTYIDYLSELIEKGELIHDYENNSGNHKIDIKLYFKNGELQKLLKGNNLQKKLKLITTIKTSNMHLYKNNVITKYSSPNQILKDYIDIRLEFYVKRKEYYIKVLQNELNLLTYRRKFIMQVLAKEIIIERRKKEQIIADLIKEEYPELSTNINNKPSYDYITTIPLFSLTQEKIDELENDFNEKTKELELYKNYTIQDLWISELDNLEKAYNKWYNNKISTQEDKVEKKKKSDSKTKTTTTKEKVNKSKITIKT